MVQLKEDGQSIPSSPQGELVPGNHQQLSQGDSPSI